MKTVFAGLCLILLMSGCSILSTEPYISTNYYDIGYPEKMRGVLDYQFNEIEFKTQGPYYEKMVFRRNNNQLAFGEYSRWATRPVKMLERYFRLAYDKTADDIPAQRQFCLTGEILQFEADLNTNMINVILEVTIKSCDGKKVICHDILQESIPVKTVTAESYAKNMQLAIDKIIAVIDKRMQQQ